MPDTFDVHLEFVKIGNANCIVAAPVNSGKKKFPAIVLNHGLSSDKVFLIGSFAPFVKNGFVVLCPDAEMHGARKNYQLPKIIESSGFATPLSRILKTMADECKLFYDYLESRTDVAKDKIVVGGYSMGGMNSFAAMMAEPRFKACAAFITTGDLVGFMVKKRGRKRTSKTAAQKMARYSVVEHPEKMQGRPIIILHGEVDSLIPVESARKTYDALKNEYGEKGSKKLDFRVYKNIGHWSNKQMDKTAANWLKKWF